MSETLAIVGLLALPLWLAWQFFKGVRKGSSAKKPFILKAGPLPGLVDMPERTNREFTFQDEREAARARQRVWMRYQDASGHITERIIEIYNPENDAVVFAWCCLKRGPRTFAKGRIQLWRLLPERFEFDPVVDQYWKEEGSRDMSEKLPWLRWLESQPDPIAKRYLR